MIYYIAFIGSGQSIGIINKISGKIEVLNKLGTSYLYITNTWLCKAY